jgi:signal transduction histidine kinase
LSHPYSILLLFIALINIALAFYALRYVRSPGALAYTIIMTFLSIYSFGYAFELQASSLQQVLFWIKIEYIGISFLPPFFLIMAAQYTGMSHLLKPWLIVPLFLISFSTFLMEFTNYGNLFYRELRLNAQVPFVLMDFVKGPWYWVHQAFANLMILFSSILYYMMFQRTTGHPRARALIMLLALDIPWCFYALYLIGGSPYNIDLCPFSFSVAGILTALGIFRYHLLEYVPLALENVFNSMTVGIVTVDEDNCLVGFNPTALEVFPDLSERMKGKAMEPVFNTLPCLSQLTDGYQSDIEISHMGTVRYFHLQVVGVKTNRGRLTGWAIIFANITERKSKENELIKIEKKLKELNASKDKFFAIIAHDLRNAFHLIINMSEMTMDNLQKDDKESALRKARIIYDTSVNTYSLLQNLLEWALMQLKGVPFKPADLLLTDLVDAEIKNLKTLSDQKNIKIQCSIDKHLLVNSDKEMLKTVFRNLISNAIKYSHPGGTISINANTSHGMATVEVCDQGIGMTRDEQNRVFKIESYLSKKGTASENGTGLGLKLCKEFIRMHGGDIWVTSEEGKGSMFVFTVPEGRGKLKR